MEDFREFAVVVSPQLQRTAFLMVGDWHEAQDLTQTALAKTFVKWRRISALDNPHAYVRKILVNEATSYVRKLARRRTTPVAYIADGAIEPALAIDDRDPLWRCLSELPRTQRTAIVLRYYCDLSERDTAEAMECSVGAVKSYTSRGLQRLAAEMTSRAVEPVPPIDGRATW